MNRRHFVKLSATTAVALIFNRLTSYASNNIPVINMPDEVWAKSGTEWFKLKPSNGSVFTYRDIQVKFIHKAGALSARASSPSTELNAIRVKWRYHQAPLTKVMGDHWERSYGDLGWALNYATKKCPWYMMINDGKATTGYGVRTGCNTICWWMLTANAVELVMDTASGGVGVQLGHRELHAADIITAKSNHGESAFAMTQRFCKMMCPNPRLPQKPVYGINDWYFAYGNNSSDLIKQITGLMTDLAPDTDNRPFSVIDAGWATYSPLLPGDGGFMDDFSKPNEKFGDMTKMADDIKSLGMQPGLWTRVLCAKHNDPKTYLLPSIPGRDDPKSPILDPTIPETIERIKHNISLYKQWGYKLVKHDYTTYDIWGKWGFQMTDTLTAPGWSFHDKTRTTAEIMNDLYGAIRESADDMYVIGCNTVSHLSAGVFELNRIGDDTSGKEWGRTRKMGVNTLGFRIPQHNAFYATDADCVGLTNDIPWEKNKQWMQLVAESGTPLFVSPDPKALGEEQKAFIKLSFAQAAKVQPTGEPLDWINNQLPVKWKLNGRKVDFEW
jgi:alpha-galactosidase